MFFFQFWSIIKWNFPLSFFFFVRFPLITSLKWFVLNFNMLVLFMFYTYSLLNLNKVKKIIEIFFSFLIMVTVRQHKYSCKTVFLSYLILTITMNMNIFFISSFSVFVFFCMLLHRIYDYRWKNIRIKSKIEKMLTAFIWK